MSHRAYLGLGSNVGDRIGNLRAAVRGLNARADIRVTSASAVYETPAHTLDPSEHQPPYLNAVVETVTTLSAEDLLHVCQRIEQERGRDRIDETRWAPRTLDIDILLFDDATRRGVPTVPHPRIAERRFVLQPLADVAADVVVPEPFSSPVHELLQRCSDTDVPRRTGYTLNAAAD